LKPLSNAAPSMNQNLSQADSRSQHSNAKQSLNPDILSKHNKDTKDKDKPAREKGWSL